MTESSCRFSFFIGTEGRRSADGREAAAAAADMFQQRAVEMQQVEMQPSDEARVKPRRVWTASKRPHMCQAATRTLPNHDIHSCAADRAR